MLTEKILRPGELLCASECLCDITTTSRYTSLKSKVCRNRILSLTEKNRILWAEMETLLEWKFSTSVVFLNPQNESQYCRVAFV